VLGDEQCNSSGEHGSVSVVWWWCRRVGRSSRDSSRVWFGGYSVGSIKVWWCREVMLTKASHPKRAPLSDTLHATSTVPSSQGMKAMCEEPVSCKVRVMESLSAVGRSRWWRVAAMRELTSSVRVRRAVAEIDSLARFCRPGRRRLRGLLGMKSSCVG
jgi:hypothetical protein